MSDTAAPSKIDVVTVLAIAALAYIAGTALHELVGHGATCAALGGRVTELSAFYATCDYTGMSDLAIRLDAVMGPVVSLVTGLIAFWLFRERPPHSPHGKFFLWLLGSIGLMTATGYLLFSGVTGLGDFGDSRDGMFYNVTPVWLWRILLVIIGALGYYATVRLMVRMMGTMIGGSGKERLWHAHHLSLLAYVGGSVISILIGLFNPMGLVIILTSAAAATLGGTSGFAWGMTTMKADHVSSEPLLAMPRSTLWIGLGIAATLLYGLIFGPTLTLG